MTEQFCHWQIKCKEDTEDTWTCTAHLAEGHAFKCRFKVTDKKLIGNELIMTKKGFGLGQCVDWQPPKRKEKQ